MTSKLATQILILLTLGFTPLVAAQNTTQPSSNPTATPDDVASLLAQARRITIEALQTDLIPTIDQRLWRDAIALGSEAFELAPEDREVLRFMARIYSYTHFHLKAWEFWGDYFEADGTLTDPTDLASPEKSSAELFALAGTELAFARYEAGSSAEALELYLSVLERLPDNLEALNWAAKIHFEEGNSSEALPYWERLAELKPEDEGVGYFLERTRERLEFGLEASDAFQSGVLAYEVGEKQQALDLFEAALAANGTFAEASAWAGRISFELGRPQRASEFWGRVLDLNPNYDGAAYFLELAQLQVQWGIPAANAFVEGQRRYGQADLVGAAESFSAATESNPDFLSAWEWAARSYQEAGQPAQAIGYWDGVLQRNPGDDRALDARNLAAEQLAYGVEAGRAFVEANAAYEVADYARAETLLTQAVTANPGFAKAWFSLGRVYFEQADFEEAVRTWERAVELEPNNDEYLFWVEEARFEAEQHNP